MSIRPAREVIEEAYYEATERTGRGICPDPFVWSVFCRILTADIEADRAALRAEVREANDRAIELLEQVSLGCICHLTKPELCWNCCRVAFLDGLRDSTAATGGGR